MIKVVKGNVVLRVDDSMLNHYVNKGYTAKTLDGKLIKEAIPSDVTSLRKAYLQVREENESLKAEIESLKAQLNKAQRPIVSVDDSIVSDDKPKRQRRKSIDEE